MEYDKPFKTFDELLSLMVEKHGLTPPIPPFARDALMSSSYYTLINGYKDYFMTEDRFRPGLTFGHLYFFHILDRGFQNTLFEHSLIIEDYFKNILAYVLAKNFGVSVSEYLADTNFIKRKTHRNRESAAAGNGSVDSGSQRKKHPRSLLKSLRKTAYETSDEPTKYYRENHNHIPPWILMRNVSFSDSIELFMRLKRKEKTEVLKIMLPLSADYASRVALLRYILTMIRKFRNTIAHNLKFINFSTEDFAKNLDKKALRQFIPPVLLTDAELEDGSLLYQAYGYILFSLLLLRDDVERVVLIHHMNLYLSSFVAESAPHAEDASDSILLRMWSSLIREYFEALRLPLDMNVRLGKYMAMIIEANKKAPHA